MASHDSDHDDAAWWRPDRQSQAPPAEVRATWADVPLAYRVGGPSFMTHTFGEMLQAMACYCGEARIPDHLLALCRIPAQCAPTPENSPLGNVDVVIVEPNTSCEIVFDTYHLNRGPVKRLIDPCRRISHDARRLASLWLEKGIFGMDEAVRRESAEALTRLIPPDHANRDLVVEILQGARGAKADNRRDLGALRESFEAPMGVAMFTWAYMPDGRPISWPAEFHRGVFEAASDLGLPTFEPRPLVAEAGVEAALYSDLRHYRIEFMPTVAKHLVEFMHQVADG